MVKVTFTENFEKEFKKIKDKKQKQSVIKLIRKLKNNPSIGKPLRYDFKKERTLYAKPFRLIYTIRKDEIILLRFLHRKDVYKLT